MAATDFQQAFSRIYATDAWVKGSGSGSELKVTAGYRRFVSDFVAANEVRSVLDFGCGDWRVSGATRWGDASYLGVDAVPSLVDELRSKHRRPGVEFEHSPALTDLPDADLLIAKDVLQHWPNEQVAEFLRVVVPRFKHALITNDVAQGVPLADRVNPDIELGEWRHLDVRARPFGADATAVHLFHGPIVRNPRNWRAWGKPVWTKMVLLMHG